MELLTLGAYLHDGQALFGQLHDILIPNNYSFVKDLFQTFWEFLMVSLWKSNELVPFFCLFALTKLAS